MAKIVSLALGGERQRKSSGEHEWFNRWVETHRNALRAYIIRVSNSGVDSDDVLQEIFLRLWRVKEPGSIQNPRAYLMMVARNTMVDISRRRRAGAGGDGAEADPSYQSGLMDYCEMVLAVERTLAELPHKCRQAFMLCRYEGLSTAEAAHRMSISERMVQKHLVKALAHFRRNLV